ncbi:MAG: SUMF1/EgtB/PvdO family nonheme iron enzyme [Planctomycetes bacterium]|nr:SUMF1/EgtB/PvdO family nonheme iron enzyme [Planctomycetota bacterium]
MPPTRRRAPKRAVERFDVFLCHNSRDKPAVLRIATALRERGLRPWLDAWEMRGGDSFLDVLERQIKRIDSAAVFVGENGRGPWQEEEIKALLLLIKKRAGGRIIPVVLSGEGKPRLPLWLQGNHWVDFRKEQPDPVGELLFAITGKRAARGSAGGGAAADAAGTVHDPNAPALRPWERAYLKRRLPAWEQGRTAEGKAYLLAPDAATELYRPDLYVPLEGESPAWEVDKKGLLSRRKRGARAPKAELERAAVARLPLGRWLSVADCPRVVLIGAPGGGKTVFLTRVAAHLAHACLDEPSELEALDFAALRRPRGGLPVPIVLEAKRVAEALPRGGDALASAVEGEVAGDGGEAPDAGEVRAGLRAGRYLLLVDAWDEIADGDTRSQVLTLWRGMAASEAERRTRLVMSTRSSRYTGGVDFGDALTEVWVRPFGDAEVTRFCGKWGESRQKDRRYVEALRAAAFGLAERAAGGEGDQALVGNPLLLTAICMVYERYRSLPEDRAQLCELLVNDLCRSRWSEDREHGWRLDDAGKRNLLQEIALAMQEEGAQSWPETRAREVALEGVAAVETLRKERAARHLQWAADHTGLLRFEQPPKGPEQVRFWHRLFREFLAASRLGQRDLKVKELVKLLAKERRLFDPFWEDVIRLLPRVLGTRERAQALAKELLGLAGKKTPGRGRLLGLVAAGVIESRDLFPAFDAAAQAVDFAATYEREGAGWSLSDRLFFLEVLGRLDPKGGDPRLGRSPADIPLVEVPGGRFRMGSTKGESDAEDERPVHEVELAAYRIGRFPITNAQYLGFVEAAGHRPPAADFMIGDYVPWRDGRPRADRLTHPVVGVSWHDAVAYCRWLAKETRLPYRLPSEAEWERAARGMDRRQYPWGDKHRPGLANDATAGFRTTTPVGAFPEGVGPTGCLDLAGNVQEWCSSLERQYPYSPTDGREEFKAGGARVLRGGAWYVEPQGVRAGCRVSDLPDVRLDDAGFRVVVSAGV